MPVWGLVQGKAVNFDAVLNKDWNGLKIDGLYAIEIGNPDYTGTILSKDKNKFVSVMLPCTIAVYEKSDGTICFSRLRTERLGQVWCGTIEDVMGTLVSRDVARIVTGN